jgi:benzoyl-CoA reductase/2-hydroxyglutaryl-CoA dehydratase subunit BcrC/BadD/HgdB
MDPLEMTRLQTQVSKLQRTCQSLSDENTELQNQLSEVEQTCVEQLEQTKLTSQKLEDTVNRQQQERKQILELVND